MEIKDVVTNIEEAKEWTGNYISILKGRGLTYKTMTEDSNENISKILDNCIKSASLLGFDSVDAMYEDHKQRMIKLRDETKQRNIRKPKYIY